jgi:hypothetical protein
MNSTQVTGAAESESDDPGLEAFKSDLAADISQYLVGTVNLDG